MKHIFSIFLSSVMLIIIFGACSDSDYSDIYADPSLTSTVSCEKLMTGVFQAGYNYTMPSYARYFTLETYGIGRFGQIMGFINEKGMYLGMGSTYFNNRWQNFYNVLSQFRLLEDTYDNLEEGEKESYEPTLWLAQIFVYEQLQEIIDFWGDAPYTEAGYLSITSDIATSYPSYESAEDLYQMMMDDLAEINTNLANLETTSFISSYMTDQDYINEGDLSLWRKYCNSLRLRIAMRAADYGDLTSTAQAVLKTMLADPTTYPLVDSNDETIQIEADDDGFDIYSGLKSGFESWSGICNRASAEMVSQLEDDPRLEIIYDPNSDGDYVGIDTHDDESTQTNYYEDGDYYSAVDTSTFSRNSNFPGILMTAAEVSFIKAEAYQKGYASGDAEEAFETAVAQSIDYYYDLNSGGDYRTPITAPSSSEIETFAAEKWTAYGSKEEAIAVQKWLHFGLIDMGQAWAEVRKTGYPELYFATDDATSYCSEVPDRLVYPTDEVDYNTDKYNEATNSGETDTYYNKIFWAKQ